MYGRVKTVGHTHGRVPGCASAQDVCVGHTHQHTWQWLSRGTHSHPLCHTWGVEPSAFHMPHSPTSACPSHPPFSLLTHRRHAHTTHSAAVGAPLCGMGQRVAAISPHSGPGPSLPDGHSPATQGASVGLFSPSLSLCFSSWSLPLSAITPLTPSWLSCPAHHTGVWEISWLRAQWVEAPGMGSQLCCGLQDSLAAPQVIAGITIKVSTQPSHTTMEVGGQLYQDPSAWWHEKKCDFQGPQLGWDRETHRHTRLLHSAPSPQTQGAGSPSGNN